jgi:hypothetical protein
MPHDHTGLKVLKFLRDDAAAVHTVATAGDAALLSGSAVMDAPMRVLVRLLCVRPRHASPYRSSLLLLSSRLLCLMLALLCNVKVALLSFPFSVPL